MSKKAFVPLFLVLLFVNPWVEALDFRNPLPFMFSHYALFISGFLFSSWYFKKTIKWAWVFSVFVAALWHTPYFFSVSATNLVYRALEESTLFLGGFSAGFSVPSKSGVFKATLFGLWVLSDTVLSVIFLVNPKLYTDYPPYSPSELQIVGVAMILFMNVIVAIVIYLYTKSVYATLGEKAID
jgi:Protein of unknown function (DUF1404).